MSLYVGDETGLVKKIDIKKGSVVGRWGRQSRSHGVQRLCFGLPGSWSGNFTLLGVGTAAGAVHMVDTSLLRTPCAFQLAKDTLEDPAARMMSLEASPDAMVAAFSDGTLASWAWENPAPQPHTYKVAANLHACGVQAGQIAVGGRDVDLRVVRADDPRTVVWKAKNLPHDELNLAVPVWVTRALWQPHAEHCIAVCTGYGQVRVYDIRAQRRPVSNKQISSSPLRAGAFHHDGRRIYTGDGTGAVFEVDIRAFDRDPAALRGHGGSVRDIVSHGDLVATCGLDRFARVFHASTRKQAAKVYCKQRLNAVLLNDDDKEASSEDDDGSDVDGADGEGGDRREKELRKGVRWVNESDSEGDEEDAVRKGRRSLQQRNEEEEEEDVVESEEDESESDDQGEEESEQDDSDEDDDDDNASEESSSASSSEDRSESEDDTNGSSSDAQSSRSGSASDVRGDESSGDSDDENETASPDLRQQPSRTHPASRGGASQQKRKQSTNDIHSRGTRARGGKARKTGTRAGKRPRATER